MSNCRATSCGGAARTARGGPQRCTPAELFERVAHINIMRGSSDSTIRSESWEDVPCVHSVQRVQKTRWGLLLRVILPSPPAESPLSTNNGGTTATEGDPTRGIPPASNGIKLRFLSE